MSQIETLSSDNQNIDNLAVPSIDLRTILRLLRKWAWLLILAGIICAGIGAWITLQIDPIFRAKSLIVIEQTRSLSTINTPDLLSNDRTNTYLEFINQGLMDDIVAAQLGIDQEELRAGISSVRINQVGRTELFEIVVEGYFPEYVSAVANTLPEALNQSISDVRMNRFEESKANISAQLNVLQAQINTIESKIERLGIARTSQEENELRSQEEILAQYRNNYANLVQSYENVRLVEIQSLDNIAVARPAKTPTEPISSNLLINTLLGFIIGVSMALTLIALVEYLDDGVKEPELLQAITNSSLLGIIGIIPNTTTKGNDLDDRLITFHESRHPLSEHYRIIRTNLRFATVDSELDAFMITSGEGNEGKSTTAANLAISLAQSGQNVLLIDADLRKPSQHTMFRLPREAGLVELIISPINDFEQYIQPTAQANLYLLSSGQTVTNPTYLLESQRFKQIFLTLQNSFDVLIFDTPPLLPVSDALILAGVIPNVIMIANAKVTRQGAMQRSVESLHNVGVRPIGSILNNYRGHAPQYYGYEEY